MWISIEQSAMVADIVHVSMGSAVRDWSCAAEFTNYGGPTGALTSIGCIFILLIFLKIGWKVSTCVRMTPLKPFLNQTTYSIVMIKNPNALYMSIIV